MSWKKLFPSNCRPLLKAIENRKPQKITRLYKASNDCGIFHKFHDTCFNKVLFPVIERDDDVVMQALLDGGLCANLHDRFQESLLRRAVYANAPNITKLLLKRGADPMFRSYFSPNESIFDLRFQNREARKELWKWASRRNLPPDNRGNTPLHYAAELGLKKQVKRCLKAGADIEHECNIGYTALMWAASRGHTKVCRLLVARGAKLVHAGHTDPMKCRKTAAEIAHENLHFSLARELTP